MRNWFIIGVSSGLWPRLAEQLLEAESGERYFSQR